MNVERHGTEFEWGPLLGLVKAKRRACRVCVRHGGGMKVRTGGSRPDLQTIGQTRGWEGKGGQRRAREGGRKLQSKSN